MDKNIQVISESKSHPWQKYAKKPRILQQEMQ